MNLSKRSLLIAAPAIILTPSLLMPVRPWSEMFGRGVDYSFLGNQFIRLGEENTYVRVITYVQVMTL